MRIIILYTCWSCQCLNIYLCLFYTKTILLQPYTLVILAGGGGDCDVAVVDSSGVVAIIVVVFVVLFLSVYNLILAQDAHTCREYNMYIPVGNTRCTYL